MAAPAPVSPGITPVDQSFGRNSGRKSLPGSARRVPETPLEAGFQENNPPDFKKHGKVDIKFELCRKVVSKVGSRAHIF